MIKMKLSGIALILAVLLSANSFAMETVNAQVLNHKEWTTGKISNVRLNDSDKNDISRFISSAKKIVNSDNITDDVMAVALVPDVAGTAYHLVTVEGMGGFMIENYLTAGQTYIMKTTLCVNISESEQSCYGTEDQVKVDAGGRFTVDHAPSFEFTPESAGEYTAVMTETIFRDKSPVYNTVSLGNIHITDR